MPIIHRAPVIKLHSRQQKTDPFGYEKFPGSYIKATGPNKDGLYKIDGFEALNPKFRNFNYQDEKFQFSLADLHGWKKAFQVESLAVTEENPTRPFNHI